MRITLVLFFLVLSAYAHAQQTTRSAVTSGGAYLVGSGYSLSISYGQLASSSLVNPNAQLNQGFQQADLNRCFGDFNLDGVINTADLLFLLAENGCTDNCNADLNGDGIVNTGDLTALLAIYGTSCP